MAKQSVWNSRYYSRSEVRRHFSQLSKAKYDALSILQPVSDLLVLLEILIQARSQRIVIRHLCIDGQRLDLLVRLVEVFNKDLSIHPRRVPIETIVLVARLDCLTDHNLLLNEVMSAAPSLKELSANFEVEVRATLNFSYIAPDVLSHVLEYLVHSNCSDVNLVYEPIDSGLLDVVSVKQQLAALCTHSIVQKQPVRISQLPFCFLPVEHFRLLYRSLRDQYATLASIYVQRAYIRTEIRDLQHNYLPTCARCRRRSACYKYASIEEHPELEPHFDPAYETTVIFVGASLTKDDLIQLRHSDLVFTFPAVQGDALMVILEGYRTVILLDGYFYQKYALTTFEVLLTLLENVRVFGASSIGAIRALELENYGMRGSGYVFETLKRYDVVPYHIVAQTYDEHDRPLSVPLVTVHRFLELAEARGLVDSQERSLCYSLAEEFHFTQLTFSEVFARWEDAGVLGQGKLNLLEAFYLDAEKSEFDVKRKDALDLIRTFRLQLEADGPDYTANALKRAQRVYMARLRRKFSESPDKTLKKGWQDGQIYAAATRRERPVAETLDLLRTFFIDLDVTVAETSYLDRTRYHMVNVVFVPLFFLGYGNSAGTGYGSSIESALVSAFAEVLERIHCGELWESFEGQDALSAETYPFYKLPFFESLPTSQLKLFLDSSGRLKDREHVVCSDLLSASSFAIPKMAARLPNSCGLAVGNSLLEAVLYGLLEVLEHDIYACYETNAIMPNLRYLKLSSTVVADKHFQDLLSDLQDNGHEIHFFNLVNRYHIPMVLCVFYDGDRRLLYAGQCCRLDMEDAIIHSLHEALNGHYVSYFGSRDDWNGFQQENSLDPGKFLSQFVVSDKYAGFQKSDSLTLSQQIGIVLDRLSKLGIDRVFACDLSPVTEYALSVVKVIVPGMDFRSGSRRSSEFERKCVETVDCIDSFVDQAAGSEDYSVLKQSLSRGFARSEQRFFKA